MDAESLTHESAEVMQVAERWTCSHYLPMMCFIQTPGPSSSQLVAARAEEGDITSHTTGFPRSRWPPALLCPALRDLALVDPVGLCCSILPRAGGHRFDEVVLVHEPKHAFLAGRDKVVTMEPSASTQTHTEEPGNGRGLQNFPGRNKCSLKKLFLWIF